MANFNKVIVMGNLTRDPELRYTPSGTPVCTLRMACNRKFKSGDTYKDEVCFLSVVVWSKTAENCNTYLKKGNPVFVEGRLQSRTWEDKDGKKVFVLEVVAENVQFLGSKKEKEEPTKAEDEWLPPEE